MPAETESTLVHEQHAGSRRWAFFEDDGTSAWLYLTLPDSSELVADCWVYNRISAPAVNELSRFRGGPPPACAGYVAAAAQRPRAERADIAFLWAPSGDAVAISVAGELLGFLTLETKGGFSRHLVREGPWGHPWDEALFQRLFGPGGGS